MDELLQRIITLKKNKGITDLQFQQDLGLGRTVVAEWKNGKIKTYKRMLPEIADYLGVSVDYLLGREKKATPVQMDEGDEDEIIYHRDGKTVRRKAVPGKEALLKQLLDELTEEPDERL